MATNPKVVEDSRDETLQDLIKLLDDALRASLIAQLCARGNSLKKAVDTYHQLSNGQLKELITPSGASGYLEFQWVAESIFKVRAAISSIKLHDFWELVRAKQLTTNVYESHLTAALRPINDSTSGIKTNLQDLYKEYPHNKVTSESLPLLRQIQEATEKIEATIRKLILLSPPAKPKIPRIPLKYIYGVFLLALLSIPWFYWWNVDSENGTVNPLTIKIERDIHNVQRTAKEDPANLPRLFFSEIVPVFSNILLLITALLGIARAFSSDSRKDTKRMSEELTKAAQILRDMG